MSFKRLAATLVTAGMLGVPTGAWAAKEASAVQQVVNPQVEVCERSLADWLSLYWRWFYADKNFEGLDKDGLYAGCMYFLPLPSEDLDPDATVFKGHLDVTIPAGTPFVLPLTAWTQEYYEGGVEDPIVPDACFDPALEPRDCVFGQRYRLVHTVATLDGQRIADQGDYYAGVVELDPPIEYPVPTDYGSLGTLKHQTVGFIVRSLPVGVHEITNYVDWGPLNFFYDNSWTITVVPRQ